MLHATCPHCNAKFRYPEAAAGRVARCQKCAAPLTLPGQAPPPTVRPAPAVIPAADRQAAPVRLRPRPVAEAVEEPARPAPAPAAAAASSVVVVQERRPAVVIAQPFNHTLHLVLTLLTCGAWLPVWIILAVVHGQQTRVY